MNERQPGTNGGAGEGLPASKGLPARNMADIARLFLDGARAVQANGGGPRRMPPKGNQAARTPEPVKKEASTEIRGATVMLALAGGQELAAWNLLLQAAQGLAEEQATTVAVVGMLKGGGGVKRTFVTDVVGAESAEELPVIRTPAEAGGGTSDMQIARALHRLRPAVGIWLIAAPDPDSRPFPAVASILKEWLLACPTDNKGLVEGYQHLKRAWVKGTVGRKVAAPAVYLIAGDYAQAAIVHKRLRQAAQEFLQTDLSLAGAGPVRAKHEADNGGEQPPIRVLSIACDGAEDTLWAATLDELCPMPEEMEIGAENEVETALEQVSSQVQEVAATSVRASEMVLDHLAQVLDPEERAALAADFDEPEEEGKPAKVFEPSLASTAIPKVAREEPPAAAVVRTLRQNRAMEEPAKRIPVRAPEREEEANQARPAIPAAQPKVAPAATKSDTPMLRAFDLETTDDRQAQWQAVERSIWDLSPRSALLDARPPMSWATETCISIDAQGRVNVWTLYKDGASWFALREWANEHRNLLALTRRDLAIDRETEVAVHIVMPLEEEEGTGKGDGSLIGMLMRTPAKNVQLYRLRHVQWNGRRGMVVVPIA